MTLNLSVPLPTDLPELRPRITVIGVGGAGGNAVNNMIRSQLEGVEFAVANTDSQSLTQSSAEKRIQLGVTVTQGLGAGSRPDIGRIAAEEALEDIIDELRGSNMAFIAAGMGGGTGTGAAPVIARAAREQGILTVGVVTKPFHFEGAHRMRIAEAGIEELEQFVDTLIIIPNQNLFRVANEKTTFADAFKMADDVLHSGMRGVTDLMVMPGLINLDFADIRAVMSEMGKAMMGTGEATGERRALDAAEAAISNPLLDDISMKGARGMLINITGGSDMTLFEVDEAANRVRSEVDPDAYIIFGPTFDDSMDGRMRVSVVATGMDSATASQTIPARLNLVSAVGGAKTARPFGAGAKVAAAGDFAEDETDDAQDPLGIDAAFARRTEPATNSDRAEDRLPPVLPSAPAMPTAASGAGHEAFIPPRPMTRSGVEPRGEADPFTDAAMKNGSRPPEAETDRVRPRVSSLFARVTGAGRASRAAKMEAKPEPTDERQLMAAKQPRLGGLNPEERLPASQPEDELLDIPAFLRRQAN